MKKTIITLSLVLGLAFASNASAHETVSFGFSIGSHGDRVYFGVTESRPHYRHRHHRHCGHRYHRHYDAHRKVWYGDRHHRHDRGHHRGHGRHHKEHRRHHHHH